MGILIEAEANIYLKGPPSITSTKKQFGIPGETVQIECVAYSIPKARHIQWSFKGREVINSLDGEYRILEEVTVYGMKSTLVVRDSDSKHFGSYNCSVANDYGHDNEEIVLSGLRKFLCTCQLSIKYLSVCANFCRFPHNFWDLFEATKAATANIGIDFPKIFPPLTMSSPYSTLFCNLFR